MRNAGFFLVPMIVSAAGLMLPLCSAPQTVTLQTGLNGYAGVIDQELRDPRQGSTGSTWHTVEQMLAIQEN